MCGLIYKLCTIAERILSVVVSNRGATRMGSMYLLESQIHVHISNGTHLINASKAAKLHLHVSRKSVCVCVCVCVCACHIQLFVIARDVRNRHVCSASKGLQTSRANTQVDLA